MNTDHDWELLLRYVTGECEPAEARETLRWINADPERSRVANELSRLHQAGISISRPWDVEAAWRNVAPAVDGASVRPARTFVPARPATRWMMRIAAGLVLATAGSALWYFTLITRGSTAGRPAVTLQEVATQRGQLTTIRLNDGSHVTLAAASRLRYARDFGAPGRPRDLYLEGRALFDVVHDSRRPFRVHMAHAVAQDIGTRFVVTSYLDTTARVAVVEGVVALRAARDTVVLGHGDVAVVGAGAALGVAHHVDLAADTAWVGGRLVFRDTPLRVVSAELARWYDLDIRLADSSLGNLLLTATFADGARGAVLADIARTLRLRVEQRGAVVWLLRQ